VAHAAVFGSRASGDNRPGSDIDITIEIDPEALNPRRVASGGASFWLGLDSAWSTARLLTILPQSFDCILEWPKVRNTRIKHSDPEKLKEATRIFGDSMPDREYPVGTILQLVPFEAMVKHPREKFPKTNGWEFFSLDVSPTTDESPKTGALPISYMGLGSLRQNFETLFQKNLGRRPRR
jgi:hypothetical protein